MDREEIARKQAEQMEKDQKEYKIKLRTQEKRIDYMERAKRLKEIPKLRAHFEEQREQNLKWFKEQQVQRVEKARREHAELVELRNLLKPSGDTIRSFASEILVRRREDYEEQRRNFERVLAEQEAQQREMEEERRRREEAERIEAERLATIKREREEQERRILEAKQREQQEKMAKKRQELDKLEQFQRAREDEAARNAAERAAEASQPRGPGLSSSSSWASSRSRPAMNLQRRTVDAPPGGVAEESPRGDRYQAPRSAAGAVAGSDRYQPPRGAPSGDRYQSPRGGAGGAGGDRYQPPRANSGDRYQPPRSGTDEAPPRAEAPPRVETLARAEAPRGAPPTAGLVGPSGKTPSWRERLAAKGEAPGPVAPPAEATPTNAEPRTRPAGAWRPSRASSEAGKR